MRRPFVTSTCALLIALAPAVLFAQDPPAQQQPAPAAPKEPRVAFTGDAGVLLFTIKGAQVAAFEDADHEKPQTKVPHALQDRPRSLRS